MIFVSSIPKDRGKSPKTASIQWKLSQNGVQIHTNNLQASAVKGVDGEAPGSNISRISPVNPRITATIFSRVVDEGL